MIELFERNQSVISRHIKNVFEEGEVDEKSNMHFLHNAFSDKPVAYYSLNVIISVGYRVKSKRGIEFRKWVNSVLKQYILKGYAANNRRLEELRQTLQIIRRAENQLNSSQILSVIEQYPPLSPLLAQEQSHNCYRSSCGA
ncbi:MAG: RhuM family protein [Treponema sp.]|nr:RhuM family protein [Treponema sp.]